MSIKIRKGDTKLGIEVYTYNLNTQETEARGLWVWDKSGLNGETLSHLPKKKQNKTKNNITKSICSIWKNMEARRVLKSRSFSQAVQQLVLFLPLQLPTESEDIRHSLLREVQAKSDFL
jgi:hypothetical protein